MTIYDPCALLARLVREKEAGWLEFKLNKAHPEEIGEYVSALANAAILEGRDRAFLVFGIEDGTKKRVGTTVRLQTLKKGGEEFSNWLGRLIEPRLMLNVLDFKCEDGLSYSLIEIEPTFDRPVRFSGTEYFRIGQHKKKLIEYPEHERALWLATSRRKFEDAVALSNQTPVEVLEKLDCNPMYDLTNEPKPNRSSEILRKMVECRFILDNLEGRYDITNLGAILLAKDIKPFLSIASKTVRVVGYEGRDKLESRFEVEGQKGYAVAFKGMMEYLMRKLPKEEKYIGGVRRNVPVYPDTAIRELIANALIHQDFTIPGSGPVVEVYENRIEIINPGNSLIPEDRMLDERRSRNEKLARAMRDFGLCEERGGGLDKTLIAIEKVHLPAPEFVSSENSMRVILPGPRVFSEMSKSEKVRACFYHCIVRWLNRDFMSNASLRERFSLPPDEYQAVSAVIAEAIKLKRIAPAEPGQGHRTAKYIPYWAA